MVQAYHIDQVLLKEQKISSSEPFVFGRIKGIYLFKQFTA